MKTRFLLFALLWAGLLSATRVDASNIQEESSNQTATVTTTPCNIHGNHEYVTHCGPYTWERSGRTYKQSGDKFFRDTTEDGCPVRDTLTLTILNARGSHVYQTNCGPYTWERSGKTYKQSGDKFFRDTTRDGCPIRDTLTLTILNARGSHESIIHCGPYTWERTGVTYKQSGDKFYRGVNADGCSVRDTLTLTILNTQGTHEHQTHRGPYTWKRSGQTYKKSGDKYFRGPNSEGCIVRDTLSLTIKGRRGSR